MTVGYGLEGYVAERDLQQVLNDFAAGIRDGGLTNGLRLGIESLTQRLRQLSTQAKAVPATAAVPA